MAGAVTSSPRYKEVLQPRSSWHWLPAPAMEGKGELQPLRFGPWLMEAVSSGKYPGLCWLDGARTVFRVPWKHNARKDVSSSDVQIFKDWAKASGRYQPEREDPARWKTNFRCALRSTRLFVRLEDCSKSDEDPHQVYRVVAEARPSPRGTRGAELPAPEASGHCATRAAAPCAPQSQAPGEGDAAHGLLAARRRGGAELPQAQPALELGFSLLSMENSPSAGTQGRAAPGTEHCEAPGAADGIKAELAAPLDPLQWVLQQCELGQQPPGWVAVPGDDLYSKEAPALLEVPGAAGEQELLLCADGPWEVPAAPCDTGLLPPAVPGPVAPGAALLQENAGGIPPMLDISIFYRGTLFHREEVSSSRCLLAYESAESADGALPLGLTWLVRFPSPAGLADRKQRRFTEELLQNTGLLLEQRDNKIFAQRLNNCKVYWALSSQLGMDNLSPKVLGRNQETEIFDFTAFHAELRDFRDYRRKHSPDFTIYLCFGQCLSNAKPKDSKLILVKLVPKFCEYWYEQVLQEGASSLNSSSLNLQLSNSFSLFELIEQYNMQLD